MRRTLLVGLVTVCGCKGHYAPPPPPATTLDAGEWLLEPLPTASAEIEAIDGARSTDVWAVGAGMFHYDGTAWTDATPPGFAALRVKLHSLSVVGLDDAWAVGDEGYVANYDGTSWTLKQPTSVHETLTHVQAWRHEVLAELWYGKGLLRFDGTGWTKSPWPGPEINDAFWGATPNDVWIPGRSVRHFDGTKWTETRSVTESFYGVHGSTADDMWMVGSTNARSSLARADHFDGTTWKSAEMPSGAKRLYAVYVVNPKEAYAVGHDTIVAWNGTKWSTIPPPSEASGIYTSVYAPGGGRIFVGYPQGKYILHKK